MRSLFEQARREMTVKLENRNREVKDVTDFARLAEFLSKDFEIKSAGPSTAYTAAATKLFGLSVDKQKGTKPDEIVPQRLVVRDARLINPDDLEKAKNTDMPMTEVKTEVNIDRITAKANPRQIERVPAGARFKFEIILNLYGQDKEDEYLSWLFESMLLLQDDYLGGNGSRGYGRVKFDIESPIKIKTAQDYRDRKAAGTFKFDIPAELCKTEDDKAETS